MSDLITQLRSYVDSHGRHLCWHKHNVESFRKSVLMSDEFAQSHLAREIINATQFLSVDVPLPIRAKAIMQGVMCYSKCIVCGGNAHVSNSISLSDPFFTKFCDNKSCQTSYASKQRKMTDECKHNHSVAMHSYKMKLHDAYHRCAQAFHSNAYDLMTYGDVCRYAKERIASQKRNGSLVPHDIWFNNCDLICSIISYTSFIEFVNKIHSIKDFNINERIFCLANKMTKRPTCKFCNGYVKFINTHHGYAESCLRCSGEKLRISRSQVSNHDALKMIDESKYEVIELDDASGSKDKHLMIKCKSCGQVSRFNLHSRCLDFYVKRGRLCKNCEKYVSRDEMQLRDFVKSLVHDDVLFNDRNAIVPYELDIYVPSKKLAIEFNGCFWHSTENKVSMKYHLHKTQRCEAAGIKLIHIWEDEWLNNRSDVEQLIKSFIDGSYVVAICSHHQVDRSKFNKAAIEEKGLDIISETSPELVERHIKPTVAYHVSDCGKLIVK